MGAILGLKGKTYRNTGTYETPVWTEMKNIKDLSLKMEKGEADATTRGNNGWEAVISSLKKGSLEWAMVYDTDDPDFTALHTAWFADTPIEFAVMDGDITTSGSQGLRASMEVFGFGREEQLTEAMEVPITAKPTYSDHPPAWYTVP